MRCATGAQARVQDADSLIMAAPAFPDETVRSFDDLPDSRFSSGAPITVDALVSKARCLAPSAGLVDEIRPHFDSGATDALVRLLESEPSALSLVMRMANAPGPRTSDVRTALTICAPRVVAAINASHALAPPPVQAPYEESVRYWLLSVATCARTIASYFDEVDRDAAYCAGMLSGFGRYVLTVSVPVQYAEIVEQANLADVPVSIVETAWVEFDHLDLIRAIAADFQLPGPLRAALGVRDEPSAIRASSAKNMLPCVVFLAHHVEAHLRRAAQGTYARGSKKKLAKLARSLLDVPEGVLDGILEEARWACFERGEILTVSLS